MALIFSDGERFATGANSYQCRPATTYETTPRMILEGEIDAIQTATIYL
ncbi:MAG TPA: hypothetical protein VI542_15000 [Candidatus Tectomicrobia bacterium]